MSKLTRHRLSAQRWRPLLAAEQEGAAWLEQNRAVLHRALAQLQAETIALHFFRWALIHLVF